jgi:glycosyl hydrolase family 109/GFO/IDH/MocA oxidoreductase family protein
MNDENSKLSRRNLLKAAGLAGVGLTASRVFGANDGVIDFELPQRRNSKQTSMMGVKFEPRDNVRLGIVGVGLRGTSVLKEFLAIDKVQVNAVCDVVKDKCVRAADLVEKAGQKRPAIYAEGERDFEKLSTRDDLDFIYIATPWEWHVPQVLAALKAGKHAGTEVPAAYTLEDCWKLVDVSETTRRHCLIMENCCYDHSETMVLNMVRSGLLGDLVHGECAYNHDLREILFEDKDEGLWRRRHHTLRDSNLYPTHGLGPMAQYMEINRGDRFEHIVSMSSLHLGLEAYRKNHVASGNAKWKEVYRTGDYNTSIIKTVKGRTILLQHNVTTPRPYDRINLVQGTNGIFRDYPPRIFIDGQEGGHTWTTLDKYKEQYESPLWKNQGETARKLGGHGGMDYLMCYRLIQCMREGLEPDINVYDAAAWSVPGPLSELSVAKGSVPIKFPDFTRGQWQVGQPAANSSQSKIGA